MIPYANLFPAIERLMEEFDTQIISEQRKAVLQPLIDFTQEKASNHQEIRLNFICTHNSRRSHFAQIWAQTMAYYFGIRNIACYSGGTEVTALFPLVAETLKKQGFKVNRISEGINPVYSFQYAGNAIPIIAFSKKVDDDFNPISDFAAIMTCAHADRNCPLILGAAKRIPITFEDPKIFDNTPQQSERYNERSRQIATELFYVFSQISL